MKLLRERNERGTYGTSIIKYKLKGVGVTHPKVTKLLKRLLGVIIIFNNLINVYNF
jgi:hypothetical protein